LESLEQSVSKIARGKISLARVIHCCSNLFIYLFIYFARPVSLYCEECVYARTYTHIWLRTDCKWITVATK